MTSIAFIRSKSRTERPRKTKIGIEVAHVSCDLDATFKVKRSKVKVTGAGAYCGGLPTSCKSSLVCIMCRIRGSDVVVETKVLVSRRLEDKKNESLGLGLGS